MGKSTLFRLGGGVTWLFALPGCVMVCVTSPYPYRDQSVFGSAAKHPRTEPLLLTPVSHRTLIAQVPLADVLARHGPLLSLRFEMFIF
jgi:hypothetical protein